MSKNDGGPAFPHMRAPGYSGPCDPGVLIPGMSLRDYFAAHALAQFGTIPHVKYEYAAEECYKIADAMLAERAK